MGGTELLLKGLLGVVHQNGLNVCTIEISQVEEKLGVKKEVVKQERLHIATDIATSGHLIPILSWL